MVNITLIESLVRVVKTALEATVSLLVFLTLHVNFNSHHNYSAEQTSVQRCESEAREPNAERTALLHPMRNHLPYISESILLPINIEWG